MNMSDVDKQLVRLKRADNLGLEISEKIKEWSQNNLDSKIVLAEDRRGWHLELQVKREPPFDEWSMLFSDSIGQLRNALDNLVFSVLTPLADTEDLPNSKLIKFPIVTKAQHWKSARKGIKHIPEPYYSRIKQVQPFMRSDHESTGFLDGLEILQLLSNSDKHNLQIVPDINTSDIQHDYSIEYATYKDAQISSPPQVEILRPVFKDGSHLVRHQSKGKIKSVEGKFHIESRVIVNIEGIEVGITQILSELWNYTAQIMILIADLPHEEFQAWAKSP
ncbi:MAG: hypothetical protein JWL85_136 [Candidatus Saccharibacteria bacterium]|nr:hypothetical protein [Candidatus Saccharibacteria bacterium]